MRDPKDMHYFMWEAVRSEANHLVVFEGMPVRVKMDINFVDTAIRRTGVFSKPLRTMACWIEEEVKEFKKQKGAEDEA